MKLLMSIIYVAIIGILAHYVGESLPRQLFFENKFPFRSFSWEKNGKIYEFLGIRKWKTKLPDMSRIMKDMLPKKVSYKASSEDLTCLIKETCVAEVIHHWLCIFSFGVYFIWKTRTGAYLVIFCVLCNIPFILIQRYNRPHLIQLRNRMIKRKEKNKSALVNSVV